MLYGLNGYRMKPVLELSKYELEAIPEPYKSKYEEVIENPDRAQEIALEVADLKQMSFL